MSTNKITANSNVSELNDSELIAVQGGDCTKADNGYTSTSTRNGSFALPEKNVPGMPAFGSPEQLANNKKINDKNGGRVPPGT
jgi:hypothetical protein